MLPRASNVLGNSSSNRVLSSSGHILSRTEDLMPKDNVGKGRATGANSYIMEDTLFNKLVTIRRRLTRIVSRMGPGFWPAGHYSCYGPSLRHAEMIGGA